MTADGWKCFLSAREFTPKAIHNYIIVLPFGVEGVDNYLQFLSSTTMFGYKFHEYFSDLQFIPTCSSALKNTHTMFGNSPVSVSRVQFIPTCSSALRNAHTRCSGIALKSSTRIQ